MKFGKPRLAKFISDSNPHKMRQSSGGAAKKLGSVSNVARHNATHMKQKMKKIGY